MTRLRVIITDDNTGEALHEIPLGNDRMWSVTLRNRGRVQTGTLTIHRMGQLFAGILKRYPKAAKSKDMSNPLIWRRRRAGPIVAEVRPLPGPVASIATKH